MSTAPRLNSLMVPRVSLLTMNSGAIPEGVEKFVTGLASTGASAMGALAA